MEFTGRRVVTGHDADGRDVIVSDGPPPGVIDTGRYGVAQLLWLDSPPSAVDDGGDAPEGPLALEPPPGGCAVRLIRFPPTDTDAEDEDRWIRVQGDDDTAPGMHATDTLDLMVVLDGRIVLGLDDRERVLSPGDAVVQRGNQHRWRVSGDVPCTFVTCMLRPDPAAAGADPAAVTAATASEATLDADGPRRVVAGTDADGHSAALADGTPPQALRTPGAEGIALVELWQTGGPLRTADQGGDPSGDWALEPRAGGVAFRSVQFPAGHDPGEAGWHTTATIDVDIVVSGHLELSLPDTAPVVLGPGESVVQRGTHHKWRPAGDEPVHFVSVMIPLA